MELGQRYSFVTILAHLLNIIPFIIAQAFIIEKAKKCLDFTVTVFFIHFLLIWYYSGHIPLQFNFLIINAVIITVTVLSAEFVLMRIEQQEIKLSFDVDGVEKIVQ